MFVCVFFFSIFKNHQVGQFEHRSGPVVAHGPYVGHTSFRCTHSTTFWSHQILLNPCKHIAVRLTAPPGGRG